MSPSSAPARTVVVTGGASSLGLAIARRFQAEGDQVYALDSDAAAVSALSGQPGIAGLVVDALDPAAIERAFETIAARSEGVDVLVNNVGLPGPRGPIEAVSLEDWTRTLTGSVGAAFFCARAVIPGMKARRRGVLVNISTSSVKTGLPNRTPYVVAKAALEAFSANCARELGPFGVRVNAIRPGALDNARMRNIIAGHAADKGCTEAAAEAELLRYFSMRSLTGLDEVADMAAFLASPAARRITGQCIGVDGNAEWEE